MKNNQDTLREKVAKVIMDKLLTPVWHEDYEELLDAILSVFAEMIRGIVDDKSFFSLTGYGDSSERIIRVKDLLAEVEGKG